ncbi:MAG: hypothetical protein JSS76_16095 [Bacteroidetes bacterium]|nr:hypothetical protein [Bacteroidota bacterium]
MQRMIRHIHKVAHKEAKNDRAYWMSRPVAERLNAIEFFVNNFPIMKVNFPPDFSEFIGLLENHEVRYIIVGGYAVGVPKTKVTSKALKRTSESL